jgi:Fe-Mn family superoxide dismutase
VGFFVKIERPVKPLKYKSLNGLSEKQLSEHHDVLYTGYIKKLSEIEDKLEKVDLSTANGTYSDLRSLKKEEVFATNAIYLHEGYFENLTGHQQAPSGPILDLIKQDFGSYEKWEAEFRAMGLAARGWVVLALNWDDMRLHNYLCDMHSEGVWDCSTLLILDVYEHAYFMDYGTARKKYIDSFMPSINWDYINQKVKALRMVEARQMTHH